MYDKNSATTSNNHISAYLKIVAQQKKKTNEIGRKVRLHFDKTKLTLRQKSHRRGEGTTPFCPLQIQLCVTKA
jgi:hypothetical protein